MGLLAKIFGLEDEKVPCRGEHLWSSLNESALYGKYYECVNCGEKRAYECNDNGHECEMEQDMFGGIRCSICGKNY